MSAVLKKLSLIQPFHHKTGWSARHKGKQEQNPVKRTTYKVDLGAPNNCEEYVKKIQDRIRVKLVAPELAAAKPAVEHIEDKNKDDKRKKIGKHVSKRLNDDRIQKMIQLDELYFKHSQEQAGMY